MKFLDTISAHIIHVFDPYPKEHAIRFRNPKLCDRVRRQNNKRQYNGKRVDVLWCIRNRGRGKKPEVLEQALRLPISQWTEAEARAYSNSLGDRVILFEPATGGRDEKI